SNPSASSDTFADLQLDSHWSGYVLLPPAYSICGTCQPDGPEGSWFIQQGISSPSLSGSSMQFGLGPHSVKYADILCNNKFTKRWVKSWIPCNPLSNAWNHLVIQVSRTTDDRLQFKSITLNGVTRTVNRFDHPSATTWYGMTINYQMDGDSEQEPYTVYLDKVSFSYK